MSETDQVTKAARPWQWPGEWFRDEKFWRDVGSRTLSGLIVLFFGYWAALLLGFIKSPDNFKNAFYVTGVALMVIATVIWNEKKPTHPLRQKIQARFPVLTGKVGAAVAYLLAFIIQTGILFVITMIGLIILRLIFTGAAALLGIEPKF
ncbi:hypothetical protein [Arthrobacter sp. C152]